MECLNTTVWTTMVHTVCCIRVFVCYVNSNSNHSTHIEIFICSNECLNPATRKLLIYIYILKDSKKFNTMSRQLHLCPCKFIMSWHIDPCFKSYFTHCWIPFWCLTTTWILNMWLDFTKPSLHAQEQKSNL